MNSGFRSGRNHLKAQKRQPIKRAMFSFKSFQIVFIVLISTIVVKTNAAATKKQDPKCLLPREPGPCRMRLSRFYYNAQTDTCEEFTFGGCKGNDNKFGFKETCEAACKLSTTATTPNQNVQLTRKQLNASTLKSLAAASPVTEKNDKSTTVVPAVKSQVAAKI